MLRRVDPALAHRLFYPEVPAVLAASSGKTVAGMPVVSYSALSQRPPLLGVSCARDSFTLRIATAAKAFSLSLLGEEHVSALAYLASHKGGYGSDKLEAAGLMHGRGSKLDAPVIVGSAASLECSLTKVLRSGDHSFLVGKVEAASASSDFRGYWRFRSYHPILYAGWQGGMSLYRPASRRKR